ncbi:MAG: hypothetical protein LBO79_09510, partial [Zoogloeaceae bacterium]|nr:hypothetical protein [Zoogloeaceae bacterium]
MFDATQKRGPVTNIGTPDMQGGRKRGQKGLGHGSTVWDKLAARGAGKRVRDSHIHTAPGRKKGLYKPVSALQGVHRIPDKRADAHGRLEVGIGPLFCDNFYHLARAICHFEMAWMRACGRESGVRGLVGTEVAYIFPVSFPDKSDKRYIMFSTLPFSEASTETSAVLCACNMYEWDAGKSVKRLDKPEYAK